MPTESPRTSILSTHKLLSSSASHWPSPPPFLKPMHTSAPICCHVYLMYPSAPQPHMGKRKKNLSITFSIPSSLCFIFSDLHRLSTSLTTLSPKWEDLAQQTEPQAQDGQISNICRPPTPFTTRAAWFTRPAVKINFHSEQQWVIGTGNKKRKKTPKKCRGSA